jgi:Flp pilus assembly protein TadG
MRRQTADGVATVEFAIILPLFVLLLFGIIEFGLAIWRQEILTNASREGARAGIVSGAPRPTSDEITAVVEASLANAGIDPATTIISITGIPEGGEGSSGDPLTVLVQYPNDFLVLPNLMTGLGASLTLRAQTVMLFE